MRYIGQFILIAVGVYCAQLYFPWWSMLVIAGLAGLLLGGENSRSSFYCGFLAVFCLYAVLAYLADDANGGVFSQKMETAIGANALLYLIVGPAFVGAVLGGFGSMTGNLFRNLFVHRS